MQMLRMIHANGHKTATTDPQRLFREGDHYCVIISDRRRVPADVSGLMNELAQLIQEGQCKVAVCLSGQRRRR
jgi:hypothetical protein